MTLTARLCRFFLGALGFVLVAFSLTLYLLGRTYLYGQVNDRLDWALDTLCAAAGTEPEGLEWEPRERRLSRDADAQSDRIRWRVTDGQGLLLDRSPQAEAGDFLAEAALVAPPGERAKQVVRWHGQPWLLAQCRLQADPPGPLATNTQRQQADLEEPKYPALVMTVAVALEPVQAALLRLAAVLVGASLGFWLLAALVGRRLCRRALGPVTCMAAAARTMGAGDLEQRLPRTATGDELDDLSRAFNGLLDRLHDSFERQRRFTGDASHQLRTPLTAIGGQIEVALRHDRSPEEYQRVLTLVQGQTLQLSRIVEMLLFLARPDLEILMPPLERIHLARWLQEHLRSWCGHPRAADLECQGPLDGPLWVAVQTPLLAQLVDNLIENACKYSEPGTAITFQVWYGQGQVVLAVEDHGRGIAAQDVPHVFEPFYRSDHARRSGASGVGLGLAIAQRIALVFGGSITVRSVPGQGSCFSCTLPAANQDEQREPHLGEGPRP